MTTSNGARHWSRMLWAPGPVPLGLGFFFVDPTIWRGLWTRRRVDEREPRP